MIINTFSSLYDIARSHSINPNIFVGLYLLTIIPCWLVVYLIIKAVIKRQTKLIMLYIAIELLLLLLPYLYLIMIAKEATLLFYIVIVVIIACTVFSAWRGIINKLGLKK